MASVTERSGAQAVSPELDDDIEDNEVKLLTFWHVACLPPICAHQQVFGNVSAYRGSQTIQSVFFDLD